MPACRGLRGEPVLAAAQPVTSGGPPVPAEKPGYYPQFSALGAGQRRLTGLGVPQSTRFPRDLDTALIRSGTCGRSRPPATKGPTPTPAW
jgi:hypothetical protein